MSPRGISGHFSLPLEFSLVMLKQESKKALFWEETWLSSFLLAGRVEKYYKQRN